MDCESDDGSENGVQNTPLDTEKDASIAVLKCREQYENQYKAFIIWCNENKVKKITENVLIAYFKQKSKKYKPSTLWSQYSVLKTTLSTKNNIHINMFSKLVAFLKQKSHGYKPNISRTFSKTEYERFLLEAPDDVYLMMKVVLIIGIAGACRCEELCKMTIDDIEDKTLHLIVSIPKTIRKNERIFKVADGSTNNLTIYRKYLALRPVNTTHRRLFVSYKASKCSILPAGINAFSKISCKIAEYLKLSEPNLYTGHCLRRSSTNILNNQCEDLLILNSQSGWKFKEEGCVENTIENEILGESSENFCENDSDSTETARPTYASNTRRRGNDESQNSAQRRKLRKRELKGLDFSDPEKMRLHSNAALNTYANISEELTEPKINSNQLMEDTCRVCLKPLTIGKSVSIFSNDLRNILLRICDIEIFENDELPSRVCKACSNQLEQVVKLRAQIETSDGILRQHLLESSATAYIKEEICEIEENEGLEEMYLKDEPLSPNMHLEDNGCDEESIDTDHDSNNISVYNNFESVEIKVEEGEENIHFPEIDEKEYILTEAEISSIMVNNVADIESESGLKETLEEQHSDIKDDDDDDDVCGKLENMNCVICGEFFRDFPSFEAHLKFHNGKFPCHICSQVFTNKSLFRAHIKIGHEKVRMFPCQKCSMKFYSVDVLVDHLRRHRKSMEFPCDKCNVKFKNQVALKNHIKQIHITKLILRRNNCLPGANFENSKQISTD